MMFLSQIAKEIRASNCQHSEDKATVIYSQLTQQLKCCVDLSKERGASSRSQC